MDSMEWDDIAWEKDYREWLFDASSFEANNAYEESRYYAGLSYERGFYEYQHEEPVLAGDCSGEHIGMRRGIGNRYHCETKASRRETKRADRAAARKQRRKRHQPQNALIVGYIGGYTERVLYEYPIFDYERDETGRFRYMQVGSEIRSYFRTKPAFPAKASSGFRQNNR